MYAWVFVAERNNKWRARSVRNHTKTYRDQLAREIDLWRSILQATLRTLLVSNWRRHWRLEFLRDKTAKRTQLWHQRHSWCNRHSTEQREMTTRPAWLFATTKRNLKSRHGFSRKQMNKWSYLLDFFTSSHQSKRGLCVRWDVNLNNSDMRWLSFATTKETQPCIVACNQQRSNRTKFDYFAIFIRKRFQKKWSGGKNYSKSREPNNTLLNNNGS